MARKFSVDPEIEKNVKIVIKSRSAEAIWELISKNDAYRSAWVRGSKTSLYGRNIHVIVIRKSFSESNQLICEADVGPDLWVEEYHEERLIKYHNYLF